jgi:hypothetical protein
MKKLVLSTAIVLGLAALFSVSAQTQVNPPSWAVGSFTGQTSYGPQITITIYRDGTVTSQIEGNIARGVYTRNDWANFGEVRVQVTRSGNAIETYNPTSGERVTYIRNNNGGYGNGNGGYGNGNGGYGNGNGSYGNGEYEGLGRPGVVVYEDRNFSGRSQSFGVGRYLNAGGQMGNIRNDKASSVVVARGYHVRICEAEGSDGLGGGRCEDYNDGSFNLQNNDQASYIEVTRSGYGNNYPNNNYPNNNYPNNNGNYNEAVYVNDLAGERTSNADTQMRARGFRNVDSYRQNGGNYTLWWRGASRQCIEVGIARGRYSTLQDIGNDQRCHN